MWVRGVITKINPKARKHQVIVYWWVMKTSTHHTLEKAPWTEGAVPLLPAGETEYQGSVKSRNECLF